MVSLFSWTSPLAAVAIGSLLGVSILPVQSASAAPAAQLTASPATPQTIPPSKQAADVPGTIGTETTSTRIFQPRRQAPSNAPATATGSCLDDAGNTPGLIGLAPQFEMGVTVATRPEFIRYLPASALAFPVEFRLLTLTDSGAFTLIHWDTEFEYAAGFMSYQMPERLPALEPDRRYYWQVIVKCNPSRPSQSLVTTAQFEVVSPSPALNQALALADTNAALARVYASDGLWYDAFSLVLQGETPEEQQLRTRLLQELAAEEANSGSLELSVELLQIADATD